MTDFEVQRQLREMNSPRMPRADLWPAIATRIAADAALPAPRRRRPAWPLAIAAAMLLAVGGSLVLRAPHPHGDAPVMAAAASPTPRLTPRDALDPARMPSGDPRLVGAAVVLDSAHAELEQALERRPDAVFLVSLLNRTNARRMKLDHFGANAG